MALKDSVGDSTSYIWLSGVGRGFYLPCSEEEFLLTEDPPSVKGETGIVCGCACAARAWWCVAVHGASMPGCTQLHGACDCCLLLSRRPAAPNNPPYVQGAYPSILFRSYVSAPLAGSHVLFPALSSVSSLLASLSTCQKSCPQSPPSFVPPAAKPAIALSHCSHPPSISLSFSLCFLAIPFSLSPLLLVPSSLSPKHSPQPSVAGIYYFPRFPFSRAVPLALTSLWSSGAVYYRTVA